MQVNSALDERLVADISEELPLPDRSVDLMTSRSVLEHLRDTEAFVIESARVTRVGGYAVHAFPSRFAPFAFANRLLPNRLSRRVLESLFPWARGVLGFPAFYDRCYPSAMTGLFEQAGFKVREMRVSYAQADYLSFFVPLYVLAAVYDELAGLTRVPDLAASALLVAQRH
jgi:2-polyprenyl-6-hydroxyphenyl methylase/3-demethylubiquinone-9 3-methyltransferase